MLELGFLQVLLGLVCVCWACLIPWCLLRFLCLGCVFGGCFGLFGIFGSAGLPWSVMAVLLGFCNLPGFCKVCEEEMLRHVVFFFPGLISLQVLLWHSCSWLGAFFFLLDSPVYLRDSLLASCSWVLLTIFGLQSLLSACLGLLGLLLSWLSWLWLCWWLYFDSCWLCSS